MDLDYGKTMEEFQAALAEYDPNEVRDDYIKRMVSEGFVIRVPKDNELFIDIDHIGMMEDFEELYEIFSRDIKDVSYVKTPSKSGEPYKFHIVITLPFDTGIAGRIAWQASLGSDPKRELLSMLRYHRGDRHPTLFVEKEGYQNEKNNL